MHIVNRSTKIVGTHPLKTIAFAGRPNLGGFRMRGSDVARAIGGDIIELPLRGPLRHYDVIVLVKYHCEHAGILRKHCDYFVADALDCWVQTRPEMKPAEFFRWWQQQTGCDAMVATSPAVVEMMKSAGVETIYAPHHADERIGRDWYNPAGPVVYAGGGRYLGSEVQAIAQACKDIGREFVLRQDKDCWQALQGAALTLSCRFGPERTPLNIWCKPGVKVANAARAGIPMLVTQDPAIFTLCDAEIVTGDWIGDLTAALASKPPAVPHAIDNYVGILRGLL